MSQKIYTDLKVYGGVDATGLTVSSDDIELNNKTLAVSVVEEGDKKTVGLTVDGVAFATESKVQEVEAKIDAIDHAHIEVEVAYDLALDQEPVKIAEKYAELFPETTPTDGDTAVVVKPIYDGATKKTYTAYVYENSAWKAMDGNYSASNVFLTSNLTYTTNVGTLKLGSGESSATAEVQGQSIQEFISGLLAETVDPTVVNPKYTLAQNGSTISGNAEPGDTISAFGWNGSYTDGTYSFGYVGKTGAKENAGCTASYKMTCTADGTFSTSDSVVDGTFTLTTPVTLADTGKTVATMTGVCTYADSTRTPVNNIGTAVESLKIAGSTISKQFSVSVTGTRRCFWGFKGTEDIPSIANPAAITSAEVRGLQNSVKDFVTFASGKTSATSVVKVDSGMKQVFFVAPAGKYESLSVIHSNSMNTPLTFIKVASGAQVEGANGYTAVAYDVWYYTQTAGFEGEAELTLTWTK